MKTINKVIIITCIFIVALIIRAFWPDNEKKDVKLIAKNVEIEKFDRKVESIDEKFKPVSGFKQKLIRPIIMKKHRNELYICDYGNMKILRVDTAGNVINAIGKGLGKGPGEFTQIMDFSFYNNSIYVLDLNKIMIMKFSLDGKYVGSVTLEDRTTRLVSNKSGFISLYLGGEYLFKKMDKQRKNINKFGSFIENQQINTLSLGGIIEPLNENEFLYAPAYASLVYYYDYKGTLKSYTKLPAGQSFSASIKINNDDMRRTMRPDPAYKTIAVSQTPERIYVQVYKQEGENIPESEAPKHRALYLNVIDKESRDYVKSYQLHEVLEEPVVIDNKIFAIRNDTSLVYHRLE